jgi:serine/threonine protein kinase
MATTRTKLGEGTFGCVFFFVFAFYLICSNKYFIGREVHKAVHKSTGKIVALKLILMHNEKDGMPVTALREIKILKSSNTHVSPTWSWFEVG